MVVLDAVAVAWKGKMLKKETNKMTQGHPQAVLEPQAKKSA